MPAELRGFACQAHCLYSLCCIHPLAGTETTLLPHAGGDAAENGVPHSSGQSVATVALLERHAKTRLAVAADHFNRDYKKGFQFLQVRPGLAQIRSPCLLGMRLKALWEEQ